MRISRPFFLAALCAFTLSCGKGAPEYLSQASQLDQTGKTEEARLLYAKALQAEPKTYEAEYRLGLLDQKAGQPAPALAHFERSLESGDIKHLQAYARLALRFYLENPQQQKLYTRLGQVSAQLRAKPGGELDALRIDGYLAVMEKRTAEAIASFEHVVERDTKPELPDVPVALLQQLLGAGEQNKANSLLGRLLPTSPASAALLDTFYLHQLETSGCQAAREALERKATLPGETGVARLQLAMHEARCHGPKAEALEIEKYLSEAKDPLEAAVKAGDYYAEQGNWAAALDSFDKAAALPNKGAKAYDLDSRRASALMGLGRMSEASETLDRLIATRPADASAKAQRGLLRMFGEVASSHRAADFQAGLKDLRDALAQDPGAVAPQIRLQWILGLARNLQFQEARGELQKILAAAPNAIAPQLVLAQLDLREGKAQSAKLLCDKILSQSPGLREARLIRALSLKQLNSSGEAAVELGKLAAQYPNDESVAVQYLAALADLPDAKENPALAGGLEKLRASDKLKTDTRYLLAEILWRRGRAAQALDVWKDIYAKTGDARALLRQSELRMSGGQMEEGCRGLEAAPELQNDRRQTLQASWWGLTALCRENRKDFTAALAAHRKALEIQPKDPVLNNNLAAFLAGQKQELDQAIQFAQAALQSSPNEAEFLDTLGWIYYQKNDLVNSRIVYRRLARRGGLAAEIRKHQELVLGTGKY